MKRVNRKWKGGFDVVVDVIFSTEEGDPESLMGTFVDDH